MRQVNERYSGTHVFLSHHTPTFVKEKTIKQTNEQKQKALQSINKENRRIVQLPCIFASCPIQRNNEIQATLYKCHKVSYIAIRFQYSDIMRFKSLCLGVTWCYTCPIRLHKLDSHGVIWYPRKHNNFIEYRFLRVVFLI